jgi:hypothetical protein
MRSKRAMVALEHGFDDNHSSDQMLVTLDAAITIADALTHLPFELNLWQAQNIWNALLHRQRSGRDRTGKDIGPQEWPEEWTAGFRELGTLLHISVDDLVVDEDAISAYK